MNKFENAALNLVLDARDATPRGGTITARAARRSKSEASMSIDVSDTGEGMPPEAIDEAFDPFFTTKPVGKGSGLGLREVFGFAKRFGGTVSIRSEVGMGISVQIQLPAGA